MGGGIGGGQMDMGEDDNREGGTKGGRNQGREDVLVCLRSRAGEGAPPSGTDGPRVAPLPLSAAGCRRLPWVGREGQRSKVTPSLRVRPCSLKSMLTLAS